MNLLRQTFAPPNLTALILMFLLFLSAAGPSRAQGCGDLDYSGVVDITDFSIFIDHLLLTQTPLSNPQGADMDGVPGVTYNDLITMWDNQVGSEAPLDCSLTPDTSFQVSDDTIKFRGSTGLSSGGMVDPYAVEIWLNAIDEHLGVSLALSYASNADFCSLDSVVGGVAARIDSENQRVFICSWPPDYHPAGEQLLARLWFSLAAIPVVPSEPIYIAFDTAGYPPSHTTALSRSGVGDRAIDGFIPSLMVDPTPISCCRGFTGNVDCDPYDIVDVSDVQVLVDHLFLTLAPLCCEAEANINYPGSGYGETDDIVDVTDLSILIDNQFLTLAPLPDCP